MHKPVLTNEVLNILNPKPNENFIDATIGSAGHSFAILEKTAPNGKILGIDWNEKAIKTLESRIKNNELSKRLILVNDNFVNLEEIVRKYDFNSANGIVFDLGMSSEEIEDSGRGFSFLRNEPLDMRYCASRINADINADKRGYISIYQRDDRRESAAIVVNNYSEKDLAEIFEKYGEEKFSRRIAKEIVQARRKKPIETTFGLAEVVKKAVPKNYERGRIHPATRVFQALRVCVNDELNNLRNGLAAAVNILSPGGRLAAISFHSLEDRIVKNYFREMEKAGKIKILTGKPITPSFEEIKNNPRARSAKLRAVLIINEYQRT